MSDIKPIETIYNGYRFRSRLEARWAVFFDYINFEYQYEPEGFSLGDGYYYLPDFYLPENDSWVEIKGMEIDDKTHEKLIRFCYGKCDFLSGGSKFRILQGQIPNQLGKGIQCYNYISPEEYKTFKGRKNKESMKRGFFAEGIWIPARPYELIVNGLLKARQARFEHGECG